MLLSAQCEEIIKADAPVARQGLCEDGLPPGPVGSGESTAAAGAEEGSSHSDQHVTGRGI